MVNENIHSEEGFTAQEQEAYQQNPLRTFEDENGELYIESELDESDFSEFKTEWP